MAKDQSDEGWAEDLVKRVGAKARAIRGKRSAAWLSDRTAELGRRVPTSVIAKLDSGHRGSVLNVSELVVIAAALGVPPVTLLYPPGVDVDVLPDLTVRSWAATQWFTGESPAAVPGTLNRREWDRLELQRRIERLADALGHALVRELEGSEPALFGEAAHARRALQRELDEATRALRDLDDGSDDGA